MTDLENIPDDAPPTTAFAALAFENRGEAVYTRLCQALMEGQLRGGERLRIRELAAAMGTSVTPVRDAVLKLVQDGALVMQSPRDIRVRQVSRDDYLEIRAIRVELEGMAAAAAALLTGPDDIARLEAILQENEAAVNAADYARALALNQAFHFEYCRLAQMPVLLEILQRLWLKMGPLIASAYQSAGRDLVDHHFPLIEALKQRNADAARLAVRTDILSGGKHILQALPVQAEAGKFLRTKA